MITTVILDIDGTLMDTNYLHVEAWARALLRVGLQAPRAAIHRQIGKGSDKLLPQFLSEKNKQQEANQLHGEIYKQFRPYAYPLPGARELLTRLHEQDLELWLATSAKPDEVEFLAEQLDAKGKLAGVISSGDVEQSKPAPDIFSVALHRSGALPHQAIAVGDTIWDTESAARSGLRAVAVLTGGAFSREELLAAGAVAVYDNCRMMLERGFPITVGGA